MARGSKRHGARSLLAALGLTLGWLGAAQAAGDVSPDVSVIPPTPPATADLSGDGLYQFIVHHATVHYVNTGTAGNLARWRGGQQSICPLTVGLTPGYNGAPRKARPRGGGCVTQ